MVKIKNKYVCHRVLHGRGLEEPVENVGLPCQERI